MPGLLKITDGEIRLLVACAQCGPIPPTVASRQFRVSRNRLDALVQDGVLLRAPDLPIRHTLRTAFSTAWNRPLPPAVPLYTPTLRTLRHLRDAGQIRGWLRLHQAGGTEHHLRLLATYLSSPAEARATWCCEYGVLDTWYRQRGLAAQDRVRAPRPRVPDAAFRELGRWIALEIHNEDRGRPERHPDIAAKRTAILAAVGQSGLVFPGWYDEYRVVTIAGQVLRYFPDGRIEHVPPVPGPDRPPDGCLPHFTWATRLPNRSLGTPVLRLRSLPLPAIMN